MKTRINCIVLVILIALSITGCNQQSNDSASIEHTSTKDLRPLLNELTSEFEHLRPQVIQPAEGYLKYPYLIPAGFYKQMWDWDGFFMGNHFVSLGQPEYLKYWALNLIEGIDEEGYVSGCATTKGPRPIFGKFSMKPFLSQGVWFASVGLDDYSWIEPYYEDLNRAIAYRETTQQDEKTGLFYWEIAMQSGADNNVAMNYFQEDTRTFLSCDASTWQLREYLAQAKIAEKLGKADDAKIYRDKAKKLKTAINEILWCNEDKIYYNVDAETWKFYKRISYSCFIPLVQKLASEADGKTMIERYLINPEHMKAEFGLRTLSIQDFDYNNKNVIVPFSNWQGPVWPIANYLYSIGLKNYGFENETAWLAETLGTLLLEDIREWDSMHENYHADTGEPLAPAADHVDINGKFVGFISWNLCIQNVLEGVVDNEWMLLEVE
jgi:alpha,alpha-trehalase